VSSASGAAPAGQPTSTEFDETIADRPPVSPLASAGSGDELARSLRMNSPGTLVAAAAVMSILTGTAHAQAPPKVVLEVEAGGLWLARNDAQIPNETGTRFSLQELIGAGPSSLVRSELTWNINSRHALRVVYAPVRIERAGTPTESLLFAGEQFAAGAPAEAVYRFSSYRATYRYRFYEGRHWSWRVGATAFVRDARVALAQGALAAEDTDLGFVPLAHLNGEGRLGDRWRVVLDLDIVAAPQGRAIDFGGRLRYALTDHWSVGAGYRTIEGGADVDQVFNFAWLNAAVASLAVTF
jgi:hypothetical protein